MAEENKQNPNGEVFIGSVEKTSGDKKSELYAKEPRRLFEFWKKFQAKQEEALKRAGISSAASKISSVRIVALKNGKEGVKVDFVGGGGVIDVGNKAHIFRRVNRSLPSPSKIRTLMAAIREKGWDAVAADLDPATREILLKACSTAGVKLEKSSSSNTNSQKVYAAQYAQQKKTAAANAQPEMLVGAAKPVLGLLAGMDAAVQEATATKNAETPALTSKEIEEMRVADALILAGMKEEVVEAMWHGGSKPSRRRDNGAKARRKTTNATLMQTRKEESKLIVEIKQGYKDIMADVRKGIVQEQIEIWRSEYYGTEDKPGLKDTISKKREEGKNLTSHEAKLAERVERLGILADASKEVLTPEQINARETLKTADLDTNMAKKFREIGERKKVICDTMVTSVQLAQSNVALKTLTSKKAPKVAEGTVKEKAASLMVPKGMSTEELKANLVQMKKKRNRAFKQVHLAHENLKAQPKEDQAEVVAGKVKQASEKLHDAQGKKKGREKQPETKEKEAEVVAEKVKQASEKLRDEQNKEGQEQAVPAPQQPKKKRESFHAHLKAQEAAQQQNGTELAAVDTKANKVSEPAKEKQEMPKQEHLPAQAEAQQHPLRGAAMTKFILDQKAASR